MLSNDSNRTMVNCVYLVIVYVFIIIKDAFLYNVLSELCKEASNCLFDCIGDAADSFDFTSNNVARL